jgi:hypothetical protein
MRRIFSSPFLPGFSFGKRLWAYGHPICCLLRFAAARNIEAMSPCGHDSPYMRLYYRDVAGSVLASAMPDTAKAGFASLDNASDGNKAVCVSITFRDRVNNPAHRKTNTVYSGA